jgi:UPF0755 protein
MTVFIRRAFTVGILLLAVMSGALTYARHVLLAPGPLAASQNVVVPRGDTEAVGEALVRAGVIAQAWQFRIEALITRREGLLRSAEFAFPPHASLADVLAILRTAHPVEHRLTIKEGLTAHQITALVDAADALSGPAPVPDEGAMLPETYAYERGTSRAALEARAMAAMDRTLAEAWATRAPDLPLATPHDALVLASIVERETAKPAERPMVAAVYLNRLRLGMKLQADPTVAYAANAGAGPLGRPLTRTDLGRDDPINTYRVSGLPPSPICSPGRASLMAVTHPADTDALYFVADGSGGHVFAHTAEEHARNVAHWRAIEASGAR